MAGSATNTTDDIGAIHSLLWAFPTPVAFFATVLAKLVFVVSKSTVKRSQFSKLVSLMIIFAFRGGRSSFYNLVDQGDTSLDLALIVGGDQTVQFILLILGEVTGPSLTLLDASLTPDADFGTAFPFHLFERITTRTNEQTEKVDLREFFDRNVDFVLRSRTSFMLEVHRGSEIGV